MRNRLFTTEPKAVETYGDICIHADVGVHEQMVALMAGVLSAPSRVLDVGAGAGAFSRRIADLGYAVTAVDVDGTKWQGGGDIPFRVLDVDRGLSSIEGPFDGVCCLEVIEHLENPWQFMRECLEIVKPGGYLFLSTPNVTSFYSRVLFLIRGRFHQFDVSDLAYGHINPMTSLEIETAATRAGWRIAASVSGGYLPVFDFSSFSIVSLALNVLRGLSFLVARGNKRGWCLLYVLQRP